VKRRRILENSSFRKNVFILFRQAVKRRRNFFLQKMGEKFGGLEE
jgi:hypothetical protein